MANGDQWYGIVTGNKLQQGDLIDACPVIVPVAPIEQGDEEAAIAIEKFNVVVLSQSCDLAIREKTGKPSLDFVLVCQVWSLSVFEQEIDYFKSKDAKEGLRRGYQPPYHLLNECCIEGLEKDFLVADFKNVYSVHFDTLINIIEKCDRRLSLLSPYREHLAQAFARFFMRMGLPSNIPEFSKRVKY